jgi:hypothetical protein
MGELGKFDRNRRLMEDLTSRTLASIPSEYGKLIYLASLRDLGSGRYVHEGLTKSYPAEAVQEALMHAHKEICTRILEMPLAKQESDLLSCLGGFEGDLEDVVRNWRELESYRALLPFGLPNYLRTLFCSDVETLLEIAGEDLAKARRTA